MAGPMRGASLKLSAQLPARLAVLPGAVLVAVFLGLKLGILRPKGGLLDGGYSMGSILLLIIICALLLLGSLYLASWMVYVRALAARVYGLALRAALGLCAAHVILACMYFPHAGRRPLPAPALALGTLPLAAAALVAARALVTRPDAARAPILLRAGVGGALGGALLVGAYLGYSLLWPR